MSLATRAVGTVGEQPGRAEQAKRGSVDAQVMLVTGGSRGIGAATARLAARHGYDVCISYIHDQAAADCALALARLQGGAQEAGALAAAIRDDSLRDATLARISSLSPAE